MEIFYLGVPEPSWLARTRVPLFVSQRRLVRRKKLPKARGRWALDSGGFSELTLFGQWITPPEAYVDDVRRYRESIGGLDWAAPQDWMCEPQMIARTGLSVYEHQRLTVANYLRLRSLAPELPFIPVLQGWTEGDYLDCVAMYYEAGVPLHLEPLVGVGSVCRRQNTARVAWLLHSLASGPTWGSSPRGWRAPKLFADQGLQLHGFGLKKQGLLAAADALASADSMAWSLQARFEGQGHQNSLDYALQWRDELLEAVDAGRGHLRHETLPVRPAP
jgi:hypothetical protein